MYTKVNKPNNVLWRMRLKLWLKMPRALAGYKTSSQSPLSLLRDIMMDEVFQYIRNDLT